MDAKFKVILHDSESKKLSDGGYRIYLRVTKDRKRKYYSLNLSALPEEWNPDAEKFRDDETYQTENAYLLQVRAKAGRIIQDLSREAFESGIDYTLSDFDKKFGTKKSVSLAKESFKEHVKDLRDENMIGNAICYERTMDMLSKFDPKFEKIYLREIDFDYVNKFNKWLIKRGSNPNTRKYYLKTLRALLRVRMEGDKALEKSYPFWRFKINKIHAEANIKEFPDKYLKKLKQARYTGSKEDARRLWLFSYYCRGMSFVDMAYLTKDNIEIRDKGEYIKYQRRKTRNTKEEGTYISILITDTIREYLEYFKTRPLIEPYLLPVMSKDLKDEAKQYNHYRDRYKKLMQWLRKINKELEFEGIKLTYHLARHTYAKALQGKADQYIIQKSLGHSDPKTTEGYQNSFQDQIDELQKVL